MSIGRDCRLMVSCARYLIRKIIFLALHARFKASINMGIYCKTVNSYKLKG